MIFSTATFHWILDHDKLFQRLAENLKPGGLLATQCGGTGNVALVLETAQEVMDRRAFPEILRGLERREAFRRPRNDESPVG